MRRLAYSLDGETRSGILSAMAIAFARVFLGGSFRTSYSYKFIFKFALFGLYIFANLALHKSNALTNKIIQIVHARVCLLI